MERIENEYRSAFTGRSEADGEDSLESRVPTSVYRRYDHYYRNSYDLYAKLGEFLKHDLTTLGDPTGNTTGGRYAVLMHPDSSVRNLRNPVHRVVEFYATAILTGTAEEAFELEGARDALRDAIHRVWEWSNLSQTKQVLKRYVAKYGEAFIKVSNPQGRDAVKLQIIRPEHVARMETDEFGNLTYVRFEIPQGSALPGAGVEQHREDRQQSGVDPAKRVRTEIYRKGVEGSPGYYRVYDRPADTSKDTVPTEKSLRESVKRGDAKLVKEVWFRPRLAEAGSASANVNASEEKYTGYDFVPIVHVKAQDTGDERPVPVYEHVLPLIDQANRRATRLDDMLFTYNKPHRAIVGIGNDANGRPLPPPQVQAPNMKGIQGQGPQRNEYRIGGVRGIALDRNDEDITLGGDLMMGLPGNSTLADITPNVDFAAQRQAVVDDIVELHEELPELHYSATADRAQLSGRALRTLLSSAIDRATEMRANIEAALIKANKMALTVGQLNGLEGFSEREIGTYDGTKDRGFSHTFKTREVLPVSDDEKAETRTKELTNAQQEVALGVKRKTVMQRLGYDEGEYGEPETAQTAEVAPDTRAIQQAQQQLARNLGGSGG